MALSAYRRSSSFVNVKTDENAGVAVLELNRAPVNSLNLEYLQELESTIGSLEENKAIKGMIITSALPNMFSAGLDIMEMYQGKEERLRLFWGALQDFWLRLYGSRLATVAAINGQSPAGGCLIALSCDYRIMAQGKFVIGLNETLLGLVAPFWFANSMKLTAGHRETEKAIQLGKLYTCEEALKVGIVDELVPPEQLLDQANQELSKWIKIPAFARHNSKLLMRQASLDELRSKKEADINTFVQFVTTSPVQKAIGVYLESLKKRKS